MKYWIAALALAACGPEQRTLTQVLVVVDAEPAIREQASKLEVSIYGSSASADLADAVLRHEQTVERPDYPVRVAIAPLGDDYSRLFRLEARALTRSGSVVAVGRLISGYTRGDLREARLVLEDSCASVKCEDPLQTCHEGTCVAAMDEYAMEEPAPETDDAVTRDAGARDARTPDARATDPAGEDEDANDSDAAIESEAPVEPVVIAPEQPDAATEQRDAGVPPLDGGWMGIREAGAPREAGTHDAAWRPDAGTPDGDGGWVQ